MPFCGLMFSSLFYGLLDIIMNVLMNVFIFCHLMYNMVHCTDVTVCPQSDFVMAVLS